MKREITSFVRRLHRDDSGAVIVLVSIMIVALVAFAALAIDIGNLAYTQRRLQATADMAAEAGALELSCTACLSGTEYSTATLYSAVSGNKNVQPGLTVTMATPQGWAQNPQGLCLKNFGATNGVYYAPATGVCTGLDGWNAIEVQEQATVPFLLGQVFGLASAHLTATSLAGAKGTGGTPPLNVMIVIDTTESMQTPDSNGTSASCGSVTPITRISCAMFLVRNLLAGLLPSQDQVGLMVFPPVTTATAQDDYSTANPNGNPSKYCPQPTVAPYSDTSGVTYQIVGVSADYRTSNTASTLNGSSQLANAAQYGPNGTTTCGVQAVGGVGTYLAGAITAAQCALAGCNGTVGSDTTGVCATQHCQNLIIVLSDGGAGNGGTLWSGTTAQATLPGGTTITMATTVPANVVPGSIVSDNTTDDFNPYYYAIPAGTQVVSTSGATVVLSSAVVAAAIDTTDAATPAGNTTLHFAVVPAAVATGMAINDTTDPSAIAACTTVQSFTGTTVTLSNAVVGTTIATGITNAATPPPPSLNDTTLFFASVPATVKVGMGVADTTHPSAIPSGTTVMSVTGNTVTLSGSVVTVNDATNNTTTITTATLPFSSVPTTVRIGMSVTGSGIPANTTVVNTTATTVVISHSATVARRTTITFSGDSVASGDTISFSNEVANGDTITFGGVGCGDTIGFGPNTQNQCHDAIWAAQDAANAGTWVYSVAYGSSTALSPNSNSCADKETPAISSCTTMQDIASAPSNFYSDGSGGSGSCNSPNKPDDLGSIGQAIASSLLYTSLLPLNTN